MSRKDEIQRLIESAKKLEKKPYEYESRDKLDARTLATMIRSELEMSVDDLAKATRLEPQTIVDYESGALDNNKSLEVGAIIILHFKSLTPKS